MEMNSGDNYPFSNGSGSEPGHRGLSAIKPMCAVSFSFSRSNTNEIKPIPIGVRVVRESIAATLNLYEYRNNYWPEIDRFSDGHLDIKNSVTDEE